MRLPDGEKNFTHYVAAWTKYLNYEQLTDSHTDGRTDRTAVADNTR